MGKRLIYDINFQPVIFICPCEKFIKLKNAQRKVFKQYIVYYTVGIVHVQ